MDIKELIVEIRDFLTTTFNDIDLWFDKDIELRKFKPQNGGWTIDQILEHIGLTNHFLLILIGKGTNKALTNVFPKTSLLILQYIQMMLTKRRIMRVIRRNDDQAVSSVF